MISEKRSSMLHGVLLITLFSCAAFYIGEMNFVKELSFSPMIVGIILGMLYANSLRNNLPETWVPGIQFCSKRILRIGIILYGFRLTFQDVLAVGLPAIFIDTIIVTTTILGGYPDRTNVENGPGHRTAHFHRQWYLRCGSYTRR